MNNPVKIVIEEKLKNNDAFSILFLGLSKNAGKTTALNYFLFQLQQLTTRTIVLLSTGYDGEETDAISGLPKPKIIVSAGNLFVTSQHAVELKKDELRIVDSFPFQTPFGKVIMAEAVSNTTVPVISAGNNEQIDYVLQQIKSGYSNPIFLIDGSINRKAFLTLSLPDDLVVLSAGGASSAKIDELIDELKYYITLFRVPVKKEYNENYTFLETIDTDNADSYKKSKIIIPDLTACFLSSAQYKYFLADGNELYYQKKTASVSMITFNPFNPTGKDLSRTKSLQVLQNRIAEIPIVDIHELIAC